MRILVTGADGFIGRQIVVACRAAGHDVIGGVRRPRDARSIACDFSRDLDPADWVARLNGFDVVVNAVGILRETRGNSFDAIHVTGPGALFRACTTAGVRRVIQISALGHRECAEYLASKHRGDDELARLDIDWTVLRPSLVYSVHGSYGGTSLLRAMAALPGVLCVPGSGGQRLQPISVEDLGASIVGLIERGTGIRRILCAVGPEQVTLLHYLQALRAWLGIPTPVLVHIPSQVAGWGAWVGEHFSEGPLGLTMWRMLEHDNVAPSEAAGEWILLSGVTPASIEESFGSAPSYVQDRWHARLYLLGPPLRIALAIVWIGSALVGFFTPLDRSRLLLVSAGLPQGLAPLLVHASSTLDLALGALALVAWRPTLVAALMVASVAAYTLVIGLTWPAMWLDPFGGLLKNLPLIPAAWMMGVLARRR